MRLTPKAIAAGCVSRARSEHFRASRAERERVERLLRVRQSGTELQTAGIAVKDDGVKRRLTEWLRFPELDRAGLLRLVPELSRVGEPLDEAVEDHRYAPYVKRQQAEILRQRADDAVQIPPGLDYAAIPGLSTEMQERLMAARPATLGAASRIRGITPAALSAILVHSRRKAA
jgi:tRNA uridine 5-carboxymethylaminomethyl modification enzyme